MPGLQDIIPMLSAILENPFATPGVIQQGIKALEAVILNAWPRIGEDVYRMTILRILVVCWGHLDAGEQLQEERKELKKLARLFVQVCRYVECFLFCCGSSY
jgi:hypothetical protein